MKNRIQRFADDGWAVWVDGDDVSSFYIDEWVNPKGKSYVDVAVDVHNIENAKGLFIYVPFAVDKPEIQDISRLLSNRKTLQAIFSTTGLVDLDKNECTSALAFHGRVVDLVHIEKIDFEVKRIEPGTLISIPFDDLQQYLDCGEAYFFFRLPHKTLNKAFAPVVTAGGALASLRNLVASPVSIERYGCSVRINEFRLLPPEIGTIGALLRQKLNRSVVTIHLNEDYRIDTSNCHRTHRMERDLYEEYAPKGFDTDNVIVYHWQKTKETNQRGSFSYYFDIRREKVSIASVLTYVLIIVIIDFVGNAAFAAFHSRFG